MATLENNPDPDNPEMFPLIANEAEARDTQEQLPKIDLREVPNESTCIITDAQGMTLAFRKTEEGTFECILGLDEQSIRKPMVITGSYDRDNAGVRLAGPHAVQGQYLCYQLESRFRNGGDKAAPKEYANHATPEAYSYPYMVERIEEGLIVFDKNDQRYYWRHREEPEEFGPVASMVVLHSDGVNEVF